MVQVAKEHLLFDEISVNVGLEDLPEKEQAVACANYLHTGSLQVNSLDQADGEDGLATVLADEQRAQLEGVETNQHLTSPLLLSTVQAVPSPTVAPLHNLLPMVGEQQGQAVPPISDLVLQGQAPVESGTLPDGGEQSGHVLLAEGQDVSPVPVAVGRAHVGSTELTTSEVFSKLTDRGSNSGVALAELCATPVLPDAPATSDSVIQTSTTDADPGSPAREGNQRLLNKKVSLAVQRGRRTTAKYDEHTLDKAHVWLQRRIWNQWARLLPPFQILNL